VALAVASLMLFTGLFGVASAQEATPAGSCQVTTEEENIALVQHWLDAWDSGDPVAFEEVLADDYAHGWAHGQDTQSEDAFLARYVEFAAAISGFDTTVTSMMTDGDLVAVSWTTTGTHSGSLYGIEPTGKSLSWTGISVYRIECGEIAESWTEMDVFSILQQVGLPDVPATPVG
jgi:steroid delta-isomerase-like uncharacterized protein